MDILENNDFFNNFINIIFEINSKMWEKYLNEIGNYIQAIWIFDDFGIQNGMLISPDTFRKNIKPVYRKLIAHIKNLANVKVVHHSCGSIFPIIGDLAEIGIDILNPLQPLAKDMNPEKIKNAYGSKISFHGGIDVQDLIVNGTPDKIIEEVKRIISILGKDGGYILAPGHNIQPDVKAENIVALFEAVNYL